LHLKFYQGLCFGPRAGGLFVLDKIDGMKKINSIFISVIILCGAFYFVWLAPRYTTPILMYHCVDYKDGTFFVSPENFAKQMEYIKKNGYEVITLDELVKSIKAKKPLKRNKVVITFDDGYQDNFKYAYPVLKKLGFPATIFLITDFVGKSFNSKMQFLDWDEIILMSKNQISFGGHTKTHFYLGTIIDEKTAFEEIAGSKKAIEDKINVPAEYFCYPSGGFNDRAKELVKQAGYQGAVTTNRGFIDTNKDVYQLKRIKPTNYDMTKPFSFWIKLSGYYNIFRKDKNPY
jgi:peptidoglycan/xylan/chitin deacetylase (PgdA/CDA1 family)